MRKREWTADFINTNKNSAERKNVAELLLITLISLIDGWAFIGSFLFENIWDLCETCLFSLFLPLSFVSSSSFMAVSLGMLSPFDTRVHAYETPLLICVWICVSVCVPLRRCCYFGYWFELTAIKFSVVFICWMEHISKIWLMTPEAHTIHKNNDQSHLRNREREAKKRDKSRVWMDSLVIYANTDWQPVSITNNGSFFTHYHATLQHLLTHGHSRHNKEKRRSHRSM